MRSASEARAELLQSLPELKDLLSRAEESEVADDSHSEPLSGMIEVHVVFVPNCQAPSLRDLLQATGPCIREQRTGDATALSETALPSFMPKGCWGTRVLPVQSIGSAPFQCSL